MEGSGSPALQMSPAVLVVQVDGEATCWRKAMACKVDSAELHRLLEGKACVTHVKEALARKADRRAVRSLQDAQQESAALADKVALVEGELHRKAAMQVCMMRCVTFCAVSVRVSCGVAWQDGVGDWMRPGIVDRMSCELKWAWMTVATREWASAS